MKVSEFRRKIDAIGQAYRSFQSAVGDKEKEREAAWVRKAVQEARDAVLACPRKTDWDVKRCSDLIINARNILEGNGVKAEF